MTPLFLLRILARGGVVDVLEHGHVEAHGLGEGAGLGDERLAALRRPREDPEACIQVTNKGVRSDHVCSVCRELFGGEEGWRTGVVDAAAGLAEPVLGGDGGVAAGHDGVALRLGVGQHPVRAVEHLFSKFGTQTARGSQFRAVWKGASRDGIVE